jgi:hypothetical protein
MAMRLEFAHQIKIGMVRINIPIPVPMAFHSFGGWKASIFGDHYMHGPEGVRFYTRLKRSRAAGQPAFGRRRIRNAYHVLITDWPAAHQKQRARFAGRDNPVAQECCQFNNKEPIFAVTACSRPAG